MAKKKVRSRSSRRPAKGASKPAKPAPRRASKPAKKILAKRHAAAVRMPAGIGKERARDLLRWTHDIFAASMADFPSDQLAYQASPYDNHVLWTLGHMVASYAWFASAIDGKGYAFPEPYGAMFGPGSRPHPDASKYPPVDELRRHFDAAYQRLVEAFNAVPDADLAKPPAIETHGFAKDKLDVILKAVWHEGWHNAQISTIRRALGLKPMMG